MRVLMTGGYGCIGSWVAKQLVERGHEVSIFDLKQDTHRLDLVLDPEKQVQRAFRRRRRLRSGSGPGSGRARVGATHILHLAGLQTPTCRADPILGAKVNVIGTLAVFRGGGGAQAAGRARGLCQLGGGAWPASGHFGGTPGRRGPAFALEPLRGLQGLQRAQCPGLLARPGNHQHRAAAVDGVWRGPRFRHDQRADQGDQGGGGRPALPHQLRRLAGSCSTSATWPQPLCGHSSIRSRGPTPSICGARSSRSRPLWRRWAMWHPLRQN